MEKDEKGPKTDETERGERTEDGDEVNARRMRCDIGKQYHYSLESSLSSYWLSSPSLA